MKPNIIREKAYAFSFNAIDLYKELTHKKEYVLSKQFLKSATSIGANIEEANAAYSIKEFSSKMSIASKEARESLYWLKLIEYGRYLKRDISTVMEENEELIKILTAIVKSSQQKIKNNN